MTRKSKKGIVGKAMPTLTQRPEVGMGLDFKQNNVATAKEIDQEIKEIKKQ